MDKLSIKQQEFLKQKRIHEQYVATSRFFLLVLFFAIWELATRLNLIDPFIFSSPTRITRSFISMFLDGSIFMHIGITLLETIVSFFLVSLLSIIIALLLWLSKSFSEVLEPYLVMLNSLPKSALAPVLIVWLGNNVKTIIIAGISVAVFGSIITLYTGFKEVDKDKIKLIYTLGGNRRHVLAKVMLPASVPMIISNMKVNIGLCLVGVIIGEFLAARAGLGYLIIYGSQVFKLDWVMMSIIILCVIAMGLYKLINVVEKIYLKKF